MFYFQIPGFEVIDFHGFHEIFDIHEFYFVTYKYDFVDLKIEKNN